MPQAGSSRYFDFAPTDRAMTVLHDQSRFVPQLDLEFDVMLDDEQLRRALVLLARRHPILQATVDSARPRVVWRPGTTEPVLVHAVDETELDPRDGPTCRLVHLRDGSRSRLLFGVHHAVADGRGLVLLLDDLRAFYAALGERWRARGRRRLDRPHDRCVARPRAESGSPIASAWVGMRPSDGPGRPRRRIATTTSLRAGATRPTRVGGATTHFERRALAAIRRAGAANGWRRNQVFLAILARAWLDVVGNEAATPSVSGWLVTVDCRRQLGVSRGVGNLSGLEPVGLADLGSLSVRETVAAVGRAFARLERPGAGMVADLASPGSGIAPGSVLDRAIGTSFTARAAAYRYTRFYSHVDRLPDSLADWGDAEMLSRAVVPEPTERAAVRRDALGHVPGDDQPDDRCVTARRSRLNAARALADRATETLSDFADEVSASRVG